MTPEEFDRFRDRVANEIDVIERRAKPMPTESTPVPAHQPSLRKAALEALLAIEVWFASDDTSQAAITRLEKAAEQLAEELGK